MFQDIGVERKVDLQATKVQKLFQNFLLKFELAPDPDNYGQNGEESIKLYHQLVDELQINDKRTLYVDFEHLRELDPTFELRECVLGNYYRYEPYLKKAVYNFIFDLKPDFAKDSKEFYLAFFNLPSVDR